MTYVQTKLRRGQTVRVAWIPSALAKKNNYLRIKDRPLHSEDACLVEDKRWQDGWLVEQIYAEVRLPDDSATDEMGSIELYRNQYRDQRKASDI